MADLIYELVWIQDTLVKMGFVPKTPMSLYCNNWSTITLYKNLFNKQMKHIEVDCYMV